jgi:hypothetical protein
MLKLLSLIGSVAFLAASVMAVVHAHRVGCSILFIISASLFVAFVRLPLDFGNADGGSKLK